MKSQIKGNSIRLRISRSELERVLRGEWVYDTVYFTSAADASLSYALPIFSSVEALQVTCEPQRVTVLLSEAQARPWAKEEQVGIYASTQLGVAGVLEVAIEKDFACLDRSDGENVDTFPDRHAGAAY